LNGGVLKVKKRGDFRLKAVILAGGLGTRLSEETHSIPKPMVEIGNRPIIWHIMKMYEKAGITDFVLCLGYKGEVIKQFFYNYLYDNSDFTINLKSNTVTNLGATPENWNVTLIDTGQNSQTGGRLNRVKDFVGHETFCLTYGDGLSSLDIKSTIINHTKNKKKATITAVVQPGRFGALEIENSKVKKFIEKPNVGGYINGGFFVLEPSIFEYLSDDSDVWEEKPLQKLAEEGELNCYVHDGFWQCMDTLRDKRTLNSLWDTGHAPWL
jgi:glucose-1-phosphate cytidylyltransferase